jgi:hypothetical protein
MPWLLAAVYISTASGSDDQCSNPARVYVRLFRELIAMLRYISD